MQNYKYKEKVNNKLVNFELLSHTQIPNEKRVTSIACIPYVGEDTIMVTKLQRGYDIPGGHVEKTDKTIESALNRELDEEAGITIPNGSVIIGVISSDFYDEETYMVITATRDVVIHENFTPQLESRGRKVMTDTEFLRTFEAGDKKLMQILFMRARSALELEQAPESRLFPNSSDEWNSSFQDGSWKFLELDVDEDNRLRMIAQNIIDAECNAVLDIGCAGANLLHHINSISYTGVDISEFVITKNAERYASRTDTSFIVSDFSSEVSDITEKYNAIVASEILYYLTTQQLSKFLTNVSELLSTEGIFIVSMCRSDRADIHTTQFYWNFVGNQFQTVDSLVFQGTKYVWDIKIYKNSISSGSKLQ